METFTHTLRYLRITPRKVRRSIDVIRGLSVGEAQAWLMASPHRANVPLLKLLRAAVSGAKQKLKSDTIHLFIKEIRVDQGPKTGRWMPRARGSGSKVERKTSHVMLTLGITDGGTPSRFTILEKPKKKKDQGKKEHKKKAKDSSSGQSEGKDHGNETQERHTAHPTEKGHTKGFLPNIFRRKAI